MEWSSCSIDDMKAGFARGLDRCLLNDPIRVSRTHIMWLQLVHSFSNGKTKKTKHYERMHAIKLLVHAWIHSMYSYIDLKWTLHIVIVNSVCITNTIIFKAFAHSKCGNGIQEDDEMCDCGTPAVSRVMVFKFTT